MFKLLIIIFLIIKTHSWTWYDYPSPRHSHLTCGLILPSYVCDPNFMLKNDQRRAIVELVEDFKEKTKRVRRLFKFYFPANFNFIAKFNNSMYERRT